ncbi:RCN1 [Candida pseudojiufengensis]|uniref:RCN1 n=1 Tax=Candida pseudojiufengensis TaxID=497109 RepID=UPI00222587D1|nr:RCN1 [Candida pseudojiufengensis]KAI5962923.1 RCN1 [Candida pseudojiufengensis]
MPRSPTNTLLLTNLSDEFLIDPHPLIDFISDLQYLVELIVLSKLSRIVIICETSTVAKILKEKITSWNNSIKVSFTIRDNKFDLKKQELDKATANFNNEINYLELPHDLDSKRFLISPPMSPQSEWNDYNKTEEGPNEIAIYSPEELSNLLWERLGGFESELVRKFQNDEEPKINQDVKFINYKIEPELLFQDVDNGVPAIILDKIDDLQDIDEKLPKTSMPPPI